MTELQQIAMWLRYLRKKRISFDGDYYGYFPMYYRYDRVMNVHAIVAYRASHRNLDAIWKFATNIPALLEQAQYRKIKDKFPLPDYQGDLWTAVDQLATKARYVYINHDGCVFVQNYAHNEIIAANDMSEALALSTIERPYY